MRKLAVALLVPLVVLPFSFALAQEISVEQRSARTQGAPQKREAPKLTKEQREQAMQMLDAAEAGARGMDAGSRAYALMQVARAYQASDKKKAVELLDEAWTAARMVGQDDDRLKRIGTRLQQQVLKAMVPLAPEKADELLPQLDAQGREQVLTALLDYYEREKMMDRALEVIYRIGQENEIPYAAASRVMEKMTPEQTADKQQLFTVALGSYRDHDHASGNAYFGDGDFANMIIQFQRDLPPSLVHQAIDVVLDAARKSAEKEAKDGSPMMISVASADGAVQLNSSYTYRLFQLLPVLRSIDPDEADRLLKQQNDVQTLLAKYPQGMSSLTGDPKSKNSNSTSFSVRSGGPGPGAGAGGGRSAPGPGMGSGDGPNLMEMQRAAKIAQDAETHPADALANTAALQSPGVRAATYIGIARNNWKKNPSVAKEALQKGADTLQQVDGDQQMMGYREIAQIYWRLGETDDAKKFVSKGMDAAGKLLKADSNADDPNRAPKAYWPSAAGYRSMLSLAAQISPAWAATLLKEIPDDELRSLGQLGMASAMLDTQPAMTEIMTFNKQGGRMMMTSDQGRPE